MPRSIATSPIPGQALAYKLGELKIRELRAKAEKELGDKFDLRRFHDAVLGQGSVPLDTLEAQINAWIVSEKAERARLTASRCACAPAASSSRSLNAWLITCCVQPVKPAGPTGEQLLMPVRP